MLIVIEGSDGTGKTTLSDALCEALSETRHIELTQHHFSQPVRHPLAEYELFLDAYRPGAGQHYIIDRLHWGEIVYGELYRNGGQLTSAGFWHVEQYLRSRGAIMVHATGDPDTVIARQADKGEDFLQAVDADQAWTRFEELAGNSLQDVYRYDSTTTTVETATRDLLTLGDRAEALAYDTVGEFPSYVGPVISKPSLLLVGEIPNFVEVEQENHAAAFVPYNSCSGKYLIDALLTRSVGAGDVGLVNAYDRGYHGLDIARLWKNLEEPAVVALGRKAAHHLGVMGVPHRESQHPQYRRRFLNDQMHEYGRELMGE